MRRDARAIIFDLDDTLYPYRRFKLSGFLAVARHLSDKAGLDVRLGFATMAAASRGPSSGRELQTCLAQHDLPADWVPELVDIVRYHQPRLSLPRVSQRVLRALRADGWRLGVLTNGPRSIQAAKVAALQLAPLVDVVGYASVVGSGRGKPDPDAFAWMARQLAVPACRAIHVGDDERCDVGGAVAAGFVPVRCAVWTPSSDATAARAVIERLGVLPAIATSLIEEAPSRHAA
jgi:putative hydrolase of the HAD superfamily